MLTEEREKEIRAYLFDDSPLRGASRAELWMAARELLLAFDAERALTAKLRERTTKLETALRNVQDMLPNDHELSSKERSALEVGVQQIYTYIKHSLETP